MFSRFSRIVLGGVVMAFLVAAVGAGRAEAGPRPPSDIQKLTGSVSAGAPVSHSFTTMANESMVIISLQARSGNGRTLRVYTSTNTLVTTIIVPDGVSSVWSTTVPVSPSSAYRVEVSLSSGSTRYTLWVNHCPNGVCYD